MAWSYETPFNEGESYAGYIAFYREKADGWVEGDDEIAPQPRNPSEKD